MLNRITTGLFCFAIFICLNDIFGWGLFPIPQHNDRSLSDVANTIMSPAYEMVKSQTGVDVNPNHTFAELARILATR